jgi:hypothetical protein
MAIDFPASPSANDTYSYGGRKWLYNGSGWQSITAGLGGYFKGGTISNDGTDPTNDIVIAAFEIIDSTGVVILARTSSITKRLDAAWAVGTNQGGLDTGAIADTTYHLWAIMRSDTGVVDVLFSTSATSPTMPANYDYKAYIAPIMRISAAIKPFRQNGDYFEYVDYVTDVNLTATTAWALTTFTVPLGINTQPLLNFQVVKTLGGVASQVGDYRDTGQLGGHFMYFGAAGNDWYDRIIWDVPAGSFTNTSAQLYLSFSETNDGPLFIYTTGFVHPIGRRP